MRDTAGEVRTNSLVIYSCGPLYMDEQRQDDQLKPTYSSSVLIQDVALGTCWKLWTIGRGGEKRSGISMLMAQHDDDEELQHLLFSLNILMEILLSGFHSSFQKSLKEILKYKIQYIFCSLIMFELYRPLFF